MPDLRRTAGRHERMVWSSSDTAKWAIIRGASFQDPMLSFEQERWSDRSRLWAAKTSRPHRRGKATGGRRLFSHKTKTVRNQEVDVTKPMVTIDVILSVLSKRAGAFGWGRELHGCCWLSFNRWFKQEKDDTKGTFTRLRTSFRSHFWHQERWIHCVL